MTDAQINAAISKITHRDEHWMLPRVYTHDLNAMHEVEKSLTYKQFENYLMELLDFIDEPILATARQRAEAFLKTLGKWEEAE
jgi:hypothetical protein